MENSKKDISVNPLAKHFRQASIHMKLPSNGKFWPENTLDMPITNQIPILPMTAKDEIILRTPDALMNGSSVVEVIHSCCPAIKDAWKMPSIDVDPVLIAIRIASYGHEMNIDTKCPTCSEENTHVVDLRVVLNNIVAPDYEKKIKIDGLSIKLKPQAFFGVNRQNMIAFEEERLMITFSDDSLSKEEKSVKIAKSMNTLVNIGIDTVAGSTDYIETSDGIKVESTEHIVDFYKNANGAIMRSIQDLLGEYNTIGKLKPQKVACLPCKAEYEVPLDFDYSNFFDVGS